MVEGVMVISAERGRMFENSTSKVMFEAGVAVSLRRLGYNYVKVNANVVS